MFNVVHIKGLPEIPSGLLEYNQDFDDHDFRPINYQDKVVRDGQIINGRYYSRKNVSTQLESWVKENIVPAYANIGISKNLGPCLGPHIDKTRFYTLQYVIEPGGQNVRTAFYEPKFDEPMLDGEKMYVPDYSKLVEVETITCKSNNWYLINGRQLHSVENIESIRIALQIGLMRNPMTNFEQKNLL